MLDKAQGDWDGKARLDRMAVDYFNCYDTPLNRAIIRKTMIAAVRRERNPVPESTPSRAGVAGRWKKSSAWRVLAGDDNFSDASILGHGARARCKNNSPKSDPENAELAEMKKAEVETVKTFASRQSNNARPAYRHFLKKQKRHSIEVGTTITKNTCSRKPATGASAGRIVRR